MAANVPPDAAPGHSPPQGGGRGWRPLGWVLLVAVLLSLLPHAVRFLRTGDPLWVCDTDELIPYGQQIAQSYRHHPWKLGDPALPAGGASMYPWVQFAPATLLARLLDLGPAGVLGVMRLLAGFSVGLGAWLLCQRRGRPVLGALLALVVITDQGLLDGVPFAYHATALVSIARGAPTETLQGWAGVLRQFRLITPGLSFLSLGLALHAFMRLREDWSRRHVAIAGLAFGYCIGTYFYFWTAIALTLVALVAIDRRHWRSWLAVAAIGGLVGAPALLQNMVTKAAHGDEWLVRNEFFVRVSAMPLSLPVKALAIHAVSGVALAFWNRRWLPVWIAGIASMFLAVSHSFTGIYIQPWHWKVVYSTTGFVLLLQVAAEAWERYGQGRRWIPVAFASWVGVQLAGAVFLRVWSTDSNREAASIERKRQEWLSFRKATPGLTFESDAVVAGDTTIADWAFLLERVRPLTGAVDLSPSVRNNDWLRRRVLNAYLKGLPPDQIADSAYGEYGVWFQHAFATPEALRAEKDEFGRVWTEIAQNPEPDLQRYGVRYLFLPSTSTPPAPVREKWELQANAAGWQVWRRTTP